MHTYRLLVLILSCSILSSCFARLDPRWKMINDSAEVPAELRLKTCEKLRAKSLQLASLRALYALDIDAGSGIQSFRLSLAFKAPDKLRLELIPPNLAVAIFLAVADSSSAKLLDLNKKQVTNFDNSEDLIKQLFNLDLAAQDLVYILSARVPVGYINHLCTENSDKVFFKYAPDGSGVSVEDKENGNIWTINLQSGLLRTALLRDGPRGWPILSSDFIEDDFVEVGHEFPHQQNAVLANQLANIKITTSLTKLNSAIKGTVFEFSVPAGFEEK